MSTSSLHPLSERIGRTAAARAGREAANTFLAVLECPPDGATSAMVAWQVLRSHITPGSAPDEIDAIVRAVMVELRALDGAPADELHALAGAGRHVR